MQKHYHVIGACSGWGAQIRACEKGPEDLLEGHVIERLQDKGIAVREAEMVYPRKQAKYENGTASQALPLIYDFNLRLADAVRRAVKNGSFPIVVGGDHASAVGTWNGVEPPIGLLWIDAHMDAHTPETTPSGAFHGMPVAALLGRGAPEMAHLCRQDPVLQPQHLALVGIRSFEEEEAALLKKLNVKIYFIEEVKRRGLKEILPEAIAHITRGVSRFGVSIDLDVFDPEEAPGVGSPEKGGIHAKELLPLLSLFRTDQRLSAFEMVEFNPERDVDHKTRELSFQILYEMMR